MRQQKPMGTRFEFFLTGATSFVPTLVTWILVVMSGVVRARAEGPVGTGQL